MMISLGFGNSLEVCIYTMSKKEMNKFYKKKQDIDPVFRSRLRDNDYLR